MSIQFNSAPTLWPGPAVPSLESSFKEMLAYTHLFKNIFLVDGHQWRNGQPVGLSYEGILYSS